jgi:sigma-B regulation protein RsbU (phosphoserine phosphatase)
MEKQNDKYFTIFYGVYRPADRTLRYSNAGHPAGLLFGVPGNGAASELESVGPGVGMLPGFPFETASAEVPAGARLLVYSDGVYEIARPGAPMWSYREFTAHVGPLVAAGGPVIDDHLAFVRRLHGGDVLGDDFSFLDVRFG